jgi:hypothetical protein
MDPLNVVSWNIAIYKKVFSTLNEDLLYTNVFTLVSIKQILSNWELY